VSSSDSPLSARDARACELWHEHYARLAGWCAVLVGDPDVARDVAAEAFTRLLAHWGTVRDPRGFLYVTAANQVKDRWRREQRDRRLAQRLVFQTQTSTPPCDPWLRDLVDRLPERLRQPVLLHYYADMSVVDVARCLRRPQGTIKRCLAEARALLREQMESREEPPGFSPQRASA
jgi:RNA polymerase sigma-70 factor, ECF subfamily